MLSSSVPIPSQPCNRCSHSRECRHAQTNPGDQCHPDADPARLCAALAKAYVDGAAAAGHDVRRLDLASIGVPFPGSKEEFEELPMPGSLVAAAEAIKWCEHLVLVMPLWLGTMPALLKAFLEQVMRPGFAFQYGPRGGAPTLLLKGRSAGSS